MRSATPDDAELILQLHQKVVLGLRGRYGQELCDAWAPPISPLRVVLAQCLLEGQSEGVWVVVGRNDPTGLVGVASLVWSTGELRAVYVDPDWTGLGVGGELIRTVERAARQRGLRGLFVESLPEAALFYTRCGYEVTGPVRVGIGGLHELAALRLEKVLLGGVQQSR